MNTKPLELDKRFEFKISKLDYRRWRAHARKQKLQLAELVRRYVNAEIARVDTLAKNVSK